MPKATWPQIEQAVIKLKEEIPPTDNLEVWRWSKVPGSRPTTKSVRLPKGYSLEEMLDCTEEELKDIGLRDKFKTNHENNFYHFNIDEQPTP